MTTPPPRRRGRALALITALAALLLAGGAPVAQAAEDIPLAPGHRLVDHYEGAPATARPEGIHLL
ncbi:hypothetical protein AB0F16_36880, partial [Streptomyces tanashiensis]